MFFFFFFQAEDGIRYLYVTGVQTCALPISGVGRTGTGRLIRGVPDDPDARRVERARPGRPWLAAAAAELARRLARGPRQGSLSRPGPTPPGREAVRRQACQPARPEYSRSPGSAGACPQRAAGPTSSRGPPC